MSNSSQREYKTIGEVVDSLKEGFPDLSISKVRYLEDEGLIKPRRTKGGYRKFFKEDIERLELVLKLQRDKYMPLDVIKKNISDSDKVKTILSKAPADACEPEEIPSSEQKEPLLLNEAVKTVDLSISELQNIETLGLIKPVEAPEGRIISPDDFEIMRLVKEFSKFGIESRHLRLYETFAEREVAFLRQILLPLMKQRSAENLKRRETTLNALLKHGDSLKRVLLKKALREYFGNLS